MYGRVLSACLIAPLVTIPCVTIAALAFPELPRSVLYVLPPGATVRSGGWSDRISVAFWFSVGMLAPAYATTLLVGLPFHVRQRRDGRHYWLPYMRLGLALGGGPPILYKLLVTLLEPTSSGVPIMLIAKLSAMGGVCGALAATTFWRIANGREPQTPT